MDGGRLTWSKDVVSPDCIPEITQRAALTTPLPPIPSQHSWVRRSGFSGVVFASFDLENLVGSRSESEGRRIHVDLTGEVDVSRSIPDRASGGGTACGAFVPNTSRRVQW